MKCFLTCFALSSFRLAFGATLRGSDDASAVTRHLQVGLDWYHRSGRSFYYQFGGEDGLCINASGLGNSSQVRLVNFDPSLCDALMIHLDGTFRPKDDQTLCLQAGDGGQLKEGTRMRLYKCDDSSELQKFGLGFQFTDGSFFQVLHPTVDPSLCMVHHGNSVDPDDAVLFTKCDAVRISQVGDLFASGLETEQDYVFIYGEYHGGCLHANSPNCEPFNILDEMTFSPHSDPTLCLQAGYGATPKDGTWMRLLPCDGSDLQKFVWEFGTEGDIRLRVDPSLCVVRQGTMGDEDAPIILKKCDKIAENRLGWSGDVADDDKYYEADDEFSDF